VAIVMNAEAAAAEAKVAAIVKNAEAVAAEAKDAATVIVAKAKAEVKDAATATVAKDAEKAAATVTVSPERVAAVAVAVVVMTTKKEPLREEIAEESPTSAEKRGSLAKRARMLILWTEETELAAAVVATEREARAAETGALPPTAKPTLMSLKRRRHRKRVTRSRAPNGELSKTRTTSRSRLKRKRKLRRRRNPPKNQRRRSLPSLSTTIWLPSRPNLRTCTKLRRLVTTRSSPRRTPWRKQMRRS